MLNVKNISSWWFFGRPSKFCGLPVYQRRGDLSCGQWRLFCFLPVIARLFFVAGVVYVGDASVSLCLLLLVSSSWLVLSVLEMQVSVKT
jgi:hypothetical protein